MSQWEAVKIALILGSIIFNAGGFVWLARNHFRTVTDKLKEHDERFSGIEQRLARIEGRLNGP
jgi:hypothetical protein